MRILPSSSSDKFLEINDASSKVSAIKNYTLISTSHMVICSAPILFSLGMFFWSWDLFPNRVLNGQVHFGSEW